MSSPTVSVVMTVFNGEEFLVEAIDSILNQSFRDFEFVIVDDGSTDGTADILSTYALRDSRIRVVRHGNKGFAASLNMAIGLAKGKHIARLDADDISMPGRLQEQVAFMERNPEVGLLGGAFELVTNSGEVIDTIRYPLEDLEIRTVMLKYNPMCHSSVMMRKNLVLALGGYRNIFNPSEDYDLWLRMSERGRLANLHNVLVRYRVHGNQMSVRKLDHQTLCVLAARAAADHRRAGRPDPLVNGQEITSQFVQSLGVSSQGIHRAIVEAHGGWISMLKDVNSAAALQLVENLTQLSHSGAVEPGILADAWLVAARIHYKQKEPARALAFAGRAFWVKPSVMGRIFRYMIDSIRSTVRVRLWHPMLNATRPVRNALGLRERKVRPPITK